MTKPTAKHSRGDPPVSLSKPARNWWRRIVGDFEIRDSAGLLLLESTLQAWDRLQEARSAILRDGVILTRPDGSVQTHPAVRLERDARSAMVAGFRALKLDLEPLGPVGRPPDR